MFLLVPYYPLFLAQFLPVGQSRPYVVLEQSVYQVTEQEGEVEVCAVLSGDLGPFQHVVGGLQTLPASAAPPARGKTV